MRSTRLVALTTLITLFGTLMVAAPAGAASSTCWVSRPAELDFARDLNSERGAAGLGKLRLDPELSKAARLHTWEMIRKSRLHHTSDERLRARVTNWVILGENVGMGPGVTSLHKAFMDSPTHRANVMRADYNHVGVGARFKDGRLWVTILFEGTTNPGTPLPMPTC